jgi:hypothetical protein
VDILWELYKIRVPHNVRASIAAWEVLEHTKSAVTPFKKPLRYYIQDQTFKKDNLEIVVILIP